MAVTKQSIIEAHCKNCGLDKRQAIICSHKEQIASSNLIGTWKDIVNNEYAVIQCQGCHNTSFVRIVEEYRISGKPMAKGEKKYLIQPAVFHYQYPDQIGHIYEKGFFDYEAQDELPASLSSLYDEVRTAFRHDQCVLAGLGLRTMVEAVCIDQKIPGRTLHDKIRKMHDMGLVSAQSLPILDKLRLIGNASAHEIKSLPIHKLELALGILNHLLMSVYVLPKLNNRLKLVDGDKAKKKKVGSKNKTGESLNNS